MKGLSYGHEDRDRDRGILTDADRNFLLTAGEDMKNEQVRRNARRRIRNRIRNAIIDFDLIARFLSEEDRRQIFDIDKDGEWYHPFQSGEKSMIEFLYTGLNDVDPEIDFETILRSGVHDAVLEDTSSPALVDVEFDVQTDVQYDIDDAREKFEEGGSLTISDIGALIATGEIEDPEELQELAQSARDKGIIQSSISPMQDRYINKRIEDGEFPGFNDGDSIPVDVPQSVRGLFSRSEPLMLLDAAKQRGEDPFNMSAGGDENAAGGDTPSDDATEN